MPAAWRDVAANLVLAAAYFGTAKLGLVFALFGSNVSLVWPASGVAVAALVLGGLRLFPGIAIGAFLANLSLGSPPRGCWRAPAPTSPTGSTRRWRGCATSCA